MFGMPWKNLFAPAAGWRTLMMLAACSPVLVGCLSPAEKIDAVYGGGIFSPTPLVCDDFDRADWAETQTLWDVATWNQNRTQMAPDRCKTDGKGMLVQTVLAGEPYRGGSMQSKTEYPYGRWVARVKPSSVPGVLNSIFTKDWDDLTTPEDKGDATKYEVDIEFLTYTFGPGKGQVHLAIHDKATKNFSTDLELDFNPSDAFRVWGFDILPDRIVWHVDGEVLYVFEKPEAMVIPENYEFFFNAWTHPHWVKGPPESDALYLIDWVRFYPLMK